MNPWRGIIVALIVLAARTAPAAPIPGYRPYVNHTGYVPGSPNDSPQGYVPITTGGVLKDEHLARLLAVGIAGGRDMDWLQIVSNPTRTWEERSRDDFSEKGMTYETDVRIANQIRAAAGAYVPWVHSPFFSDGRHDYEQGRLWAAFTGDTIFKAKGNEWWHVSAGNLPHQKLIEARAEGFSGDDFRVVGLNAGFDNAVSFGAFERGYRDAGGTGRIVPVIEGFAPTAQHARNQIDGWRLAGIDPAAVGARISIAHYAAGSATDLQGLNANSSDAQIAAELMRFVRVLVGWAGDHRALARAEGLPDVVDAYEYRIGTYPTDDPAFFERWRAFQYSPAMADVQAEAMRLILDASGGPAAAINWEGIVGHPWGWWGFFSLNNWPDTTESAAYRGLVGTVDVPEPYGMAVAAILAAFAGRYRPRKGKGRRERK